MGRVVIASKSSGDLGVPASLLIKNNVNPICAWMGPSENQSASNNSMI